MKDILEPLKKAIAEASSLGQNVVILQSIEVKIIVEEIKQILSDAISQPHWDKNGYLDGGTIYKDCIPIGHIDPIGEPGQPGKKGKKRIEDKKERGSNARATCRLGHEFLADCPKWMESEDGCLYCDHHGHPNEFD